MRFSLTNFTTLSNFLTLLRAPLALLFLYDSTAIRLIAIGIAMLTDALDGFIARRFGTVTHIGTLLDPIMDRFFVIFLIMVLFSEQRLDSWQIFAMLFRDIVLCVFAVFLRLYGNWDACHVQATFWGKATTFGQFSLLTCLTLGLTFPWFIYLGFIAVGLLLVKEIIDIYHEQTVTQ